MSIIDFRYRPSTRESLDSFIKHPVYRDYIKRTPFASTPDKSLEACVEELRSLGVEKAVYTGRDCESTYNYPPSNDLVLECMKAYPDLFIGFYGFDPHKKMDAVREFRRAVEKDGMRGASIEPCMAHLRSDDALYYPLYTVCCELNVPVIITAGLSPFMPGVSMDPMHPVYIDNVARDFPDLRILISHGGYPWMLEAVAVTQRNANVYLDFSTCVGKPQSQTLIDAAASVISRKVLFASANPFVNVTRAVEAFRALPFSPEVMERISVANGREFLGL
ncbi:amidohydrolase family protein [uncultured Mailhella sp.]|uniref:amidohydrolase family protein n=1 Tax=uncultured Mailhella sp. TaxID=1981031 RepID=UPI0025D62F5C|nr:amidohydrolase family protein [uncultured Mailhella sp.]